MSVYKPWKAFEGEITRKLKALGIVAERNWAKQFVAKDGVDIIAPPYALQLKYGKKPNIIQAHKEAIGNNLIPVGVARFVVPGKRAQTLVCIDFDTFLRLITKYGKQNSI